MMCRIWIWNNTGKNICKWWRKMRMHGKVWTYHTASGDRSITSSSPSQLLFSQSDNLTWKLGSEVPNYATISLDSKLVWRRLQLNWLPCLKLLSEHWFQHISSSNNQTFSTSSFPAKLPAQPKILETSRFPSLWYQMIISKIRSSLVDSG
jgi:hypothetical protein